MFSGGQKAQKTISFYYHSVIDDCKANNRWGTAENYTSSLKSLIKFRGKDTIFFEEITPDWLRKYEHWMLGPEEKSRTTIGIYLRPLRAIFNKAIADNVINDMVYPFGKNKYKIPAPRPVKKALNKQELKTLMDAEPENEFQEKAKDFWFFSFACNGINLKDVSYLKWKNLKGDELQFVRAKTIHTSEGQKTTTIYLNNFAKSVIEKYGYNKDNPNGYIFPVLKDGNSIDQDKREIGNFVRFINQHIKNLARKIEIDDDISYQWARHSFATYALENNAGIELISESLGHSNIKTTQNYLNGFSGETKRKLSETIMKF
jgi:site-specific recombinase XerD